MEPESLRRHLNDRVHQCQMRKGCLALYERSHTRLMIQKDPVLTWLAVTALRK